MSAFGYENSGLGKKFLVEYKFLHNIEFWIEKAVWTISGEPLKIKRRGDDGYRVISIRIALELLNSVDEIAKSSNRSRNEIINLILRYGTKNIVFESNER